MKWFSRVAVLIVAAVVVAAIALSSGASGPQLAAAHLAASATPSASTGSSNGSTNGSANTSSGGGFNRGAFPSIANNGGTNRSTTGLGGGTTTRPGATNQRTTPPITARGVGFGGVRGGGNTNTGYDIFTTLIRFASLILILLTLGWAWRAFLNRNRRAPVAARNPALDELDGLYARGEVKREDYLARRADITAS